MYEYYVYNVYMHVYSVSVSVDATYSQTSNV